jgi:hypothetical protein
MSMDEQNKYVVECLTFSADNVQSLVWWKGNLWDWVSGDVQYQLDGSKSGPTVVYPYRFDAAVMSPSGAFVALYERLGTKAIICGPNDLFREINRSYYHAHVYEYPILFFRLADGREALAHCPEEYCDLRIEDPVSGEVWSEPETGKVQSMFHSRLAANHAGNRLMSVGWVWHPFDMICVYDFLIGANGLLKFEKCDEFVNQGTEINSAVFNKQDQLIITSANTAEDFCDDEPGERLRPGMIGLCDLNKKAFLSLSRIEDEVGTLMPVGSRYALGLYDHPKLIEVATGRVLCRWPELATGEQASSILWHKSLPPPVAFDPAGGRLAVADGKKVTVIRLSPELLD